MPDIAVGNIVQVRIEYECLGQKDLSVLHWRVKQANAGVELFSFLKNNVTTELVEPGGLCELLTVTMSNQCKVSAAVAQVIKPIRYRHVARACNWVGQEAFVIGTNNLACAVTQSGILAGRGKSGRTSVPGRAQKWQVDGKWEAAVTTQLQTVFDQWRTVDWTPATSGVTMEPIIYNPSTGAINLVTACLPQSTIRVMRRRTLGVGQ